MANTLYYGDSLDILRRKGGTVHASQPRGETCWHCFGRHTYFTARSRLRAAPLI
jgi:hypothetical protein